MSEVIKRLKRCLSHSEGLVHDEQQTMIDAIERIRALESELQGRECYGDWCGKSPTRKSSGLCPACEWRAIMECERDSDRELSAFEKATLKAREDLHGFREAFKKAEALRAKRERGGL